MTVRDNLRTECRECDHFCMVEVGPYSDDPKRPFCELHDSFLDDWSSNPETPEWCPINQRIREVANGR